MSKWINEFAGKAENILNSIDKNATKLFEEEESIDEDAQGKVSTKEAESGEEFLQEENKNNNNKVIVVKNTSQLEQAEKKLGDASLRIQDLEQQILLKNSQLNECKIELERLTSQTEYQVKDHEEYRIKAQKILAEKDKIISELKNTRTLPRKSIYKNPDEPGPSEIIQITLERDHLQEQANILTRRLKEANSQINDIEDRANTERMMFEKASLDTNKRLEEEIKKRIDTERELENRVLEINALEDIIAREQASYLSSIQTRDAEMERMRNELARHETNASKSSTMLPTEEKRIKDLTSALVQRQALISSLQSEKTFLSLRIEKLERESMSHDSCSKNKSYHSSSHQSQELHHVYVESPFDSGVTRNVRKAYSSIDGFSVWIGIMFRRYPLFRIAIMIYGIFLHLWVFTVLFHNVPDFN